MATYQYVKTDGTLGTTTDQKNAPGIDPSSGFRTISATGLGTSPTPITVPTAPTGTNPAPLMANITATLGANANSLAPQQTQQTDPYAALKDMVTSLSAAQPDYSTLYANDYANSGVAQAQSNALLRQQESLAAQSKLAATNAQIQGIVAQGQQMNLLQEGRQAPISAIQGQQAENNRQTAIAAIPLQIQALGQQASVAAAQGNAALSQSILEQAQGHLDTLFKIHAQDAQQQYDFKKTVIGAVYDFASKQQQAQLDALSRQADYAQQEKMAAIQNDYANQRARLEAQLKQSDPLYQAQLVKAQQEAVAASGQAKETQNLTTVNSINNILNSAAFNSTFGLTNIVNRNIPGTSGYVLSSEVNNLISNLALAARGQLKGQGQVSDFEGRLLRDAQTALKLNMTPAQARQELINVRGAIMTSSGLQAPVKVTASNGMVKFGPLDQAGIMSAISQGYTVEYQ